MQVRARLPTANGRREIVRPDPCQCGLVLAAVKAWPGSASSAAPAAQRPALTASRHEANAKSWVGTKKRAGQVEQRNRPLLPVSLFDRWPFLRPDLLCRRTARADAVKAGRRAGGDTRAVSPGHALTAASTASNWLQSAFAKFCVLTDLIGATHSNHRNTYFLRGGICKNSASSSLVSGFSMNFSLTASR